MFAPMPDTMPKAHSFHGFFLPGYYEDEDGDVLTAAEFIEILHNREGVIVFGDAQSVLRIGPTGISNKDGWVLEKSNLISHFLEVVQCLTSSKWIHTAVTFSQAIGDDRKPTGTPFNFTKPDIYTVNSVLVLIRQLHLAKDALFRKACTHYFDHCSHEGKKSFIRHEMQRFNSALDTPSPFLASTVTGRELVDLFLYNFGLIHRPGKRDVKKFTELVAANGGEACVLGFHFVLLSLACHAHLAAVIVAQDFEFWTKSEGVTQPNRISLSQLLGPSATGTGGTEATEAGSSIVTFKVS